MSLNSYLHHPTHKRVKLIEVKKDYGVDNFTVYSDSALFFTDEEQLPDYCFDENMKEGLVDLPDEIVTALSQPEQTIKYGKMRISEFDVQFVGYGKHTDEEFWGNISYDVLFPSVHVPA